MQAGKQRGALPLIRKFNEHSERLLKCAWTSWCASVMMEGRREGTLSQRCPILSYNPWDYSLFFIATSIVEMYSYNKIT